MKRRSRVVRLVAGLGSILAIVALLVGIPAALLALAGSPIPAALPSWQTVLDTLGSREVTDTLLVDVVAIIGWIAWLQIATSTAIELAAWGRGRPAPHLRLAGPAQPIVRQLIATTALLLSSSNAAAHASTLPAHPIVATAAPLDTAPASTIVGQPPRPAAGATPSSAATAEMPSHTVVRYDTLWGLAEAHLGDPLRWQELYTINQGRPQPDGGALCEPGLIRPGWTLLFPADAAGLPFETPPAPQPEPVPVPIAPALAVRDTQEATPPAVATTVPAPSSTAAFPATAPTVVRATSPTTTPAPLPTDSSADETDTTDHQVPWPLIGGGLATAGLVVLLNRLRRVQQRRRPPGMRPQPLRPELEEIERRLRHLADLDAAERLDLALRALSAGLALLTPVPKVLAVRNGTQHVEILLDDDPPAPPKGFLATDHERGWITDPDLDTDELRALADGAAAPLPALVSLGELDDEHLLIDLETAGLLTVAGSDTEGVLHSIVMQLATARWIDHVDLLVVTSASTADVAGAGRTRHVPDLDTAIAELRAIARSMNNALDAAPAATTLEARFSDHQDDGWIPTVLVSMEPASDHRLAELADIVGDGLRGVAAVIPSTTQARWHIAAEGGELRLAPLGLSLVSSLIEPDIAGALDELLTDAAINRDFVEPRTDDDSDTTCRPIEPYTDPTYEIEVRVLGPVEIHGIPSPIQRRRAEELIAYLALHPKGATDDRIKTVLWRDRAPTTPTFNTTVSFARTALGRDAHGNFHLPHYSASARLYRLGPAVTTDLARLEARLAHAHRCPPELAIGTLRSALELVRGLPFEGARGYEWAYSEHIVAHAEAAASDAANRLAGLYLEAGDHQGATWAALQGLKACPADEGLYRARMKACHLAGNPVGAEAAFQELCDAVDSLEPYDCLQQETLELRRARPKR